MPTLDLLPFINPWLYALMGALICGSAFVQGISGVGFTLVAAPVAAMVCPELVPGALLTLGSFVTLLTAIRERRHIAWSHAGSALIGRAAGTIVAVFLLTQLAQRPLHFLFSGLIILAVGLTMCGLRIQGTRLNISIAGVISGIMGTLTSVGAPALVIILHNQKPPVLRATIGAILFCGSVLSLFMLALTDHYHAHEFWLSATLIPFMLMGFWLSGYIRHKVTPTTLHKGLLIFCLLSAIALLIKTI
ncbi:sulfite exporter TauE/SafE family protein [Advenella mimigardefordensis]|uniref:Probable membrane transporter protein n=1 Tax=Advenella mimigardefordensis (strain DSM 17166 / LMG 22922 / DPN7) TaxID=1247726 RepID=W0PIR3_ADVMD|nr:sulfite exporter TauE/SafE family protein [Advenella mimigardefordensis]AHG65415.1 putative sulfite exporter TauE [Advenella mimigardefordensis DPN7]